MATADLLSPDTSPGGATNESRLITGVRRVNNRPLLIIGAGIALFLGVVASVVIARSNDTAPTMDDLQQPTQGASSADMARQVAGTAEGGEVVAAPYVPANMQNPPVMVPGPVVLDPNGVPLPPVNPDFNAIPVAPFNPDLPPVPPGGIGGGYEAPPAAPQISSRRQRIEEMRLARAQQFIDAVRAPSTVRAASARSAGSPGAGDGGTSERLDALRQQLAANAAQGNPPSSGDLAALAALQGQSAGGGAAGGQGRGAANSLGQFGNRQSGDRWQLDAKAEAPRSRYELRAGFVIPGTLISGINSQLPGQIVAQVSQNVFDTATGRFLIIPQGSRLVGSYSADVEYGQSRVLIAWQRIVFPDGKAMDIGTMPGSDSAGYGGFKDKVNNHYFRIFGSALLMSGVTAGATLSQPQSNFQNFGQRQSAGSALSEALGQQLGSVTAALIEKNLNIAPTLTIRPGFRFNVVVTKDLAFSKPYRAFDY